MGNLDQYRILFLLMFIYLKTGLGQTPDEPLYGPHTAYSGPYYLRVFVTYAEESEHPWTNGVNLDDRTNTIFNNLNAAFNRYNIFFIGNEFPCRLSYRVLAYDQTLEVIDLDNAALDIYDLGEDAFHEGHSFGIPSTRLKVAGQVDGNMSMSLSTTLIHLIGHCLGLSNLFTGIPGFSGTGYNNDCYELDPNGCSAIEVSASFCCGDYVADTPILNTSEEINGNANCTQSQVDPLIFRNYMNYSDPTYCRTEFTTGQVQRMWDYLANSAVLNGAGLYGIQVKNTVYPANSPAPGISGNIIVESGELVINAPLEMLPGATIRVKQGASLVVNSSVSGACNQMWRGIIIEGSTFLWQTPANQGMLTINSGGRIEHAEVAIDVQNSDAFYNPRNNTGGGIVRVVGGQLVDNRVGIRFGPYAANAQTLNPNTGRILGARFLTTDAYRGGGVKPVYLELDGIIGLKIISSQFNDLRTQCNGIASRSIGINAQNAGFRASACSFQNLYYGIRADELVASTGSFLVGSSRFTNCYRGLSSNLTNHFSINYNQFDIGKPANCTEIQPPWLIGVEITGMTNGLTIRGNEFYDDDNELPEGTLIGTFCQGLGAGLFNQIVDNQYKNLDIGNQSIGNNSGQEDGLLYICNENIQIAGADFINFSGGIKPVQANINDFGFPVLPAGNKFSGLNQTHTLSNFGSEYTYVFDSLDHLQRPGIGAGIQGSVSTIAVHKLTVYCAESAPCDYCPASTLAMLKAVFSQNKSKWMTQKAALRRTTQSGSYNALLDTINGLRVLLNRDGNRILKHYSLDTTGIQLDSILTWMSNIQTFQLDLRLAKHHFFSKNLQAFDAKWIQIKHSSDLSAGDWYQYLSLDTLYEYLRPLIESDVSLNTLSADQIAQLKVWAALCNERGAISKTLLWRNGIEVQPDCQDKTSLENSLSNTNGNTGKSNLKLFPNPAQNFLAIQFSANPQALQIEVFDSQGRLALSQLAQPGTSDLVLNIETLPNGLYFLNCLGTSFAAHGKFIISR